MLGIAALGTAVGAASKGYMEGEKHRSDMEDAEMRRELAGTQLRKAKREEEYEREVSDLYKDVQKAQQPAQAGGIATPAAPSAEQQALANDNSGAPPVSGTPVAAPAKAGITPPGGAAAPSASGLGNLASMQGIIERRQALDLKYGKINEVQALQMMKNYNQLQKEGVIEGFDYFQRTGDREGAIQRINATGAMKLDPNASFKIENKEIAPGVNMPNVVVTSPDGQHSFNQYDAMTGALSPEKAFSLKHEVGFKLADLAIKKTAEENLNKYRMATVNNQNLTYQELVRHNKEIEKESAERLKAIIGAKELAQRESASKTAFSTILQGEGISKEMTLEKLDALPKKKQEEYRARVDRAQTAHALWDMNVSPDSKQLITPAEAVQIVRQLPTMKEDQVKYDKYGRGYITYGDKEVLLPGVMKQQEQAQGGISTPAQSNPAAGPATPAAPAQGSGGIAQPPSRLNEAMTPQAQQAGAALDSAKTRVQVANERLRTYGLRQQQQDPQGFAATKQELARAQADLEASQRMYEQALPRGLTTAFTR